MSIFFAGLQLSAQSFQAGQTGFIPPRPSWPDPTTAGISEPLASSIDQEQNLAALNPQPLPPAEIGDSLSLVALNPQPLLPQESGFNDDLVASLPSSFLDTVALNPQPLPPAEIGRDVLSPVALNPQPLPPRELPATLNLPASLTGGLMRLLPTPAQLLGKANVIGSVSEGMQSGADLQRYEMWRDVARSAGQIGFGGTARERHTLKNLISDDVAHGEQRTERDEVLPFDTSDFIGGIGSQPIEGDRMRAPLFVQGAGDADEVSMNDIKQRAIGDCYFMGSLAAVARHDPQRIKDMVTDNGDGTYTVTFKERVPYTEPPQYTDHPITVTGDFPGGVSGWDHAGPGDLTDQGTLEIWPLVFEKAYGQYVNEVDPYGTLDLGGQSRVALEAIAGQPVKARGDMEDDLGRMGISNPIYLGPTLESADEMLADFQAGKAITVCTSKTTQGLVPSHCYAVADVYRDANGQQWVQLYNPWGKQHPAPMRFEDLQALRIYTT